MTLKPIQNRIIISPIDQDTEEVRPSGIIAIKKDVPPSTRGTVLAIGDRVSSYVKVGDTVQYAEQSGRILEWEDKEYLIMREPDIICVL